LKERTSKRLSFLIERFNVKMAWDLDEVAFIWVEPVALFTLPARSKSRTSSAEVTDTASAEVISPALCCLIILSCETFFIPFDC
jgi:hypothetical protein